MNAQAWLHDAIVTVGWILVPFILWELLFFPISVCGILIGLFRLPWRELWKAVKPILKQLYEAYQVLSTLHAIAWLLGPRRRR